jgi:N6-L-threonylcarbamoyladenine synthase
MIVLGIETSCDETAVALVRDDKRILSNVIHAQIDVHQPYGGVVPEIAARNHLAHLNSVVTKALNDANLTLLDVDAIAVTAGPGLIGGVMVGVMAAKAMAASLGKPFIAVNHLEGHALTARLTNDVAFPFLLMLMSGGHCQILVVKGLGDYTVLGKTIDDAAGEAFDKVAKSLDLDYPGGPQVELLAKTGNAKRFVLPRPLKGREGCDFSFAGLKTAARNIILAGEIENDQDKSDLCAGFQEAVKDCLVDRLKHALDMVDIDFRAVVLAGGVAANEYLRAALTALCHENSKEFIAPPLKLCTDNAVMIAWAGIERLNLGQKSDLNFQPRPRWPLADLKG